MPGIRLQDAETVGRVYEMYQAGKFTDAEWTKFVDDLRASGKVKGIVTEAPAASGVPLGDIVNDFPVGSRITWVMNGETIDGTVTGHAQIWHNGPHEYITVEDDVSFQSWDIDDTNQPQIVSLPTFDNEPPDYPTVDSVHATCRYCKARPACARPSRQLRGGVQHRRG